MFSEKFKIGLGFAVASLIWGSTWLVIKLGLESIPPFYGAAFRFTVAVFILFLIITFRKMPLPLDKLSIKIYSIAGLMSFSVPFAMVYWGQQYIASGLSSLLFALYPLLVGIFSHLLLPSEQLNIFKITGIILGFSGIFIIFSQDISWNGNSLTVYAMLAVILSCVIQALSLVLIKKYGENVNAFHLNTGGMGIGVIILFLFALLFEDFNDVKFDLNGIGSILYLGILGSVVTFSTYFWMLKRVEAVYLSLLAFITPILAVILGSILLDEKLGKHVIQGGALVLLGILLSNGKQIFKIIYNKLETYEKS